MDYFLKIREESEKLEEEVTRLERETLNLRFQNFEKDKILETYKDNMKSLNGKMGVFEQEIRDLKDQKFEIQGAHEKEVKCLNGKVGQLEQTISELNKKLSKLENEVLEKDKILGMYEKVTSFKANTGLFEQEIKVLKGQKIVKDQIISDLNAKQIKIKDELYESNRILGSYEDTIKYFNEKVGLLEGENRDLKSENVTAHQMFEKMKSEKSRADHEMGKLKNQVQEKDLVVGMHEEQVKCLNGIVGQLELEIEELKAEKMTAGQMFEKLKRELSKANAEKDEILRALNEKIGELNNQVVEKAKVLQIYEEKLKCSEKEVEQADQQIENLKREQRAAGQMIKKVKCEQQAADQTIEKMRHEQLEVDQMIMKMNSAQAKASDEKTNMISGLNDEIGKLKNEVVEKDEVIGMYVEKLKFSDAKIVVESEGFKRQKLAADQLIEEMKKAQSQANDEKIKKNGDLTEEIGKVKNLVVEKDGVVGMYAEKVKFFYAKLEQAERENEDLKGKTVAAHQIVEKMKSELSKADAEKTNMISELNDEIGKLKNEVVEKDEVIEMYVEKLKFSDAKVEQGVMESEGFKHQKLAADQMIEEMKRAQSHVNDENIKKNGDLIEEIGKLKSQVVERDGVVGMYTEKVKFFDAKLEQAEREKEDLKGKTVAAHQMVEKMKSELSKANDDKTRTINVLNEEIGKLKNVLVEKDQVIRMQEEKQEKSKVNHETKKSISELKKNICKLEKQILEKDQVVGMYQEDLKLSNAKVGQLERESRDLKDQILSADQMIEKMKCKQLATDNLIEKMKEKQSKSLEKLSRRNSKALKILDNWGSQALVPTNKAGKVNSEVRVVAITMPKVLSACNNSTKRSKNGLQKTGSRLAGSSGYSSQAEIGDVAREKECKRLKGNSGTHENLTEEEKISEKAQASSSLQNMTPKLLTLNGSEDGDSSDSDDKSCSESAINNILANARCQKLCKPWVSIAEMQKELEDNIESCMNAVCALYRHNISSPGELSQFDAMRGNELAEYLMSGDAQHRLRKLVSEVKPDSLTLCRKLANYYCMKLFGIYNNGEDPLFRFRFK